MADWSSLAAMGFSLCGKERGSEEEKEGRRSVFFVCLENKMDINQKARSRMKEKKKKRILKLPSRRACAIFI